MIGNLKDYKCLEDEYIKDNMLYCKKCNGERYFESPDGKWKKIALCNCQTEKLKELNKEEQKRKNIEYFKRLQESSLLSERYKLSNFNVLDMDRPSDFKRAVEKAKSFVRNWEHLKNKSCGMFLYGNTGTGKTEITVCIGNELLKNLTPVMFTSFVEIQKYLKRSFDSNDVLNEYEYINKLANVDLLILDDLGTENLKVSGNSWLQEKIYDIINLRYNNCKPIIFSSNYSLSELESKGFEKRTIERINEISTFKIELKGDSYRKIKKQKDLF